MFPCSTRGLISCKHFGRKTFSRKGARTILMKTTFFCFYLHGVLSNRDAFGKNKVPAVRMNQKLLAFKSSVKLILASTLNVTSIRINQHTVIMITITGCTLKVLRLRRFQIATIIDWEMMGPWKQKKNIFKFLPFHRGKSNNFKSYNFKHNKIHNCSRENEAATIPLLAVKQELDPSLVLFSEICGNFSETFKDIELWWTQWKSYVKNYLSQRCNRSNCH